MAGPAAWYLRGSVHQLKPGPGRFDGVSHSGALARGPHSKSALVRAPTQT